MEPFVAVLATLDTKEGEAFFLRDVLAELGHRFTDLWGPR